jgi:hypothetical protein
LDPKTLVNGDNREMQDSGERSGRYANYFKVGHNAFEFVFDFGQAYAPKGPASLHTRIIIPPFYAKSLLGLLKESIDQHEQIFGTIPSGEE